MNWDLTPDQMFTLVQPSDGRFHLFYFYLWIFDRDKNPLREQTASAGPHRSCNVWSAQGFLVPISAGADAAADFGRKLRLLSHPSVLPR